MLLGGVLSAPLCPELVSIEEWLGRGPFVSAVVFGVYGRSDLSNWERCRVPEANQLYINKMALDEKVSSRGGSQWTEHPMDPACDPY